MRPIARTFLLSLLALTGPTIHAQDLLDKVAQETCECMDSAKMNASSDERKMELGLCLLQHAAPYKKELKKKFGFDLDKFEKDGEAFGRAVGMRMAVQCPQVITAISKKDEAEEEVPPPPPVALGTSVSGKLVTVRSGQFLTLVVLADDGRTLDLLLLGQARQVDGVLRRPEQGRGATGLWYYRADELFDPQSRTYRPFYVLTGFESQ